MASMRSSTRERVSGRREALGSIAEVAEYLGYSVQTLYNWRNKGIGPRGIRVGGRVRYRWSDVERWLDEQADAGRHTRGAAA
jgi:excisionase family DNA binding protein